MYLAENIRYLRKKNNMSQEDLADILDRKSFTTIQKWESGVSDPPFKILKRLSEIFNVDMDTLANVHLESDADIFARTAEAFNEAHPYFPYPNEDMHLTSNEKVLINKYRTLNDEGQNKLMERVDELIELVKYSKSTEREKMA